jgi:CDP-diacylglycerol--glycerol-3-phosphate 3-phosphatidyltransferase
MFQLPNALTVLRILLVPVFALAFMVPGETGRLSAFAIFCLAGVSDVLDGFAARKLQASSEFGRMLDPIADKILVGIALVMLVARHIVFGFELVPALVILAREILVSGLREFLATASVSVPVTRVAKFKTVLQMISIGAMILGPSAEKIWPLAIDVAYALLWTAAALTVYTGLAYFRAGFAHFRSLAAAQPRTGQSS